MAQQDKPGKFKSWLTASKKSDNDISSVSTAHKNNLSSSNKQKQLVRTNHETSTVTGTITKQKRPSIQSNERTHDTIIDTDGYVDARMLEETERSNHNDKVNREQQKSPKRKRNTRETTNSQVGNGKHDHGESVKKTSTVISPEADKKKKLCQKDPPKPGTHGSNNGEVTQSLTTIFHRMNN